MYHKIDIYLATEEIEILVKALTLHKDQDESFSSAYRTQVLIDYFTDAGDLTLV